MPHNVIRLLKQDGSDDEGKYYEKFDSIHFQYTLITFKLVQRTALNE